MTIRRRPHHGLVRSIHLIAVHKSFLLGTESILSSSHPLLLVHLVDVTIHSVICSEAKKSIILIVASSMILLVCTFQLLIDHIRCDNFDCRVQEKRVKDHLVGTIAKYLIMLDTLAACIHEE